MKKILLIGVAVIASLLVLSSFTTLADESTWVSVVGKINFYGTEPVVGWCGAHGKIGEWANVCAAWMSGLPEIPPPEGETVTFTFYAALLVEASVVELDYMDSDLYIAGIWDVYNATFVYEPCENVTWTIELIADDADGEFAVTGNWTAFTITITGIEPILGQVTFYCVSTEPIPVGDCTLDRTVDIHDLVRVAKAYGCTPGTEFYWFDLDLNFDFTIDIYDLTTVAAHLGEDY